MAESMRCWHGGREHAWEPDGDCPPRAVLAPMAVTISQPEQDHQAVMRALSYELAVQRGHVRR